MTTLEEQFNRVRAKLASQAEQELRELIEMCGAVAPKGKFPPDLPFGAMLRLAQKCSESVHALGALATAEMTFGLFRRDAAPERREGQWPGTA